MACSVSLERQSSRFARCSVGSTFGCVGSGRGRASSVWVSQGCRGRFLCDGRAVRCGESGPSMSTNQSCTCGDLDEQVRAPCKRTHAFGRLQETAIRDSASCSTPRHFSVLLPDCLGAVYTQRVKNIGNIMHACLNGILLARAFRVPLFRPPLASWDGALRATAEYEELPPAPTPMAATTWCGQDFETAVQRGAYDFRNSTYGMLACNRKNLRFFAQEIAIARVWRSAVDSRLWEHGPNYAYGAAFVHHFRFTWADPVFESEAVLRIGAHGAQLRPRKPRRRAILFR